MEEKIKLVIELNEELYKFIVEYVKDHYISSDDVWIAVANGKPYESKYVMKEAEK